jgi:hypothetical protein
MHEHQVQIVLGRVEFGQSDVLDLLSDMLPINAVHALPAAEVA